MKDSDIAKLKFIQNSLLSNIISNAFNDINLCWSFLYCCDVLPDGDTYERAKVFQKSLSELHGGISYQEQTLLELLTHCSYKLSDQESCHILVQLSAIFLQNRRFHLSMALLAHVLHVQHRAHFLKQELTLSDFHKTMLSIAEKINLPTIDLTKYTFKKQNINLAYVVDVIAEGHGPTNALISLVRSHDRNIFNLTVYVTNFENDSRVLGTHIIQELVNSNVQVVLIDPPNTSSPEKVRLLIDRIIGDKNDIVVFQAPNCPISSVAAMNRVSPLMIHWVLGGMFYHTQIDHHIIPGKSDYHLYPHLHEKATVIPLGSDFHRKISNQEKYHWEINNNNSIIIGSIGHLHKMANSQFIPMVAQILKDNQNSSFMFAGDGNNVEIDYILGNLDKQFPDRVRYMGFLKDDLPRFICSLDLCINTYPMPGGTVSLEVMAAGVPIISLVEKETSSWNCVYDNIGVQEVIIPSSEEDRFYEVVKRLINDNSYRKEIGNRLRERYFNEFTYEIITKKHEELLLTLYRKKFSDGI